MLDSDMKNGIRQRGKNSYQIVISRGKDAVTGKYQQYSETFRGSKNAAKKRRADLITQLDKGTFIQPKKITMADYLLKWLTDYAQGVLRPNTYERYEIAIRTHLIPAIGSIPLNKLSPEHIQQHYTDLEKRGLKPLTIRKDHTVLHKALQTAIKWKLLNYNACDGAEPPKAVYSEIECWDDFEVRQFLDSIIDSDYYPLFHTALYSGMRRSELLALRWSDIDLLTGTISVTRGMQKLQKGGYIFNNPKTKKSKRMIQLSPASIAVLREHLRTQEIIREKIGKPLRSDDLVFSKLEGEPLRPNSVSRAWLNLAKKAGVKIIRMHGSRHTHASLMLEAGIHPKIVQERLGHSSISVTLDIYSRVKPQLQEAAALAFDKLVSPAYNDSGNRELEKLLTNS
ncbi:tyrosine-type recombinase/integrase [Chloroflexota bacterium]